MNKAIIIGIGNPYRGDDAVGLELAASLQRSFGTELEVAYCQGETLDLLDLWKGRDQAFLVDAVASGPGDLGTLHQWFPDKEQIPALFTNSSTHLLDVAQVIELGKALGNIPKHVVLFGIEAGLFSMEKGMSHGMKEKLPALSDTIENEIRRQLCTK